MLRAQGLTRVVAYAFGRPGVHTRLPSGRFRVPSCITDEADTDTSSESGRIVFFCQKTCTGVPVVHELRVSLAALTHVKDSVANPRHGILFFLRRNTVTSSVTAVSFFYMFFCTTRVAVHDLVFATLVVQ